MRNQREKKPTSSINRHANLQPSEVIHSGQREGEREREREPAKHQFKIDKPPESELELESTDFQNAFAALSRCFQKEKPFHVFA